MTHPIRPVSRAEHPVAPTGAGAQHRGGSFAELLQRTNASTQNPDAQSLARSGADLLRRVSSGERYMDSIVRQGLSGRAFTNEELLTVQARIYRYTQEVELVSKIVDKTTGAVKTVLQSGNG